MVGQWEQHRTDDGTDCRIMTVRANISSSLPQLALAFALISGMTLLIAVFLTVLGYWPVLAFAALHLLIVGWALRVAWRNNWHVVMVAVDRDQLRLLANHAGHASETTLPSAWCRVDYRPGSPPAVANRVWLVCRDTRLEMGRFLNDQERELMARRLQQGLSGISVLERGQPDTRTAGTDELIA